MFPDWTPRGDPVHRGVVPDPRGRGIRHAPVRDHAEVVADASVWENGYLTNVDTAAGSVAAVASPVRFSATPARTSAVAPELGRHTEEVLLELGYTWEEIAGLSGDAVV